MVGNSRKSLRVLRVAFTDSKQINRLSLTNCADCGTLEGGLFLPRIYINPAEYANRSNCSGSKKLIMTERVLGRDAL